MGRPPLAIGEPGLVSVGETAPYIARTRVRGPDGKIRIVKRRGSTKGATKNASTKVLKERKTRGGVDNLTSDSTIEEFLAVRWPWK